MRMLLSEALANKRGHPLDVALEATVFGEDGEKWRTAWRHASDESRRDLELDRLMRFYPQLGVTVREWGALAVLAERFRIIAPVRKFQTQYRQDIHASVWRVLCELDKVMGPADRKALVAVLQGSGL